MKSNFFKYFFIIFVIVIIIFAIYKMKNDETDSNENIKQQTLSVEEEKNTELKLGIASFDSINPILSKNKNVQDISKIIYDSLITLTSDYKAQNSLAQEWAKQNDTTYLIRLKDNIKWSNGDKFTAEDVKFTIDRLKDTDSIYSSNVLNVIKVEIVDELTLKITLDKEVPFFEYYLTFPIMSSKYYSDKEFLSNIVPVGTGMYKIVAVQSSSLILTKNENYWEKDKNFVLNDITINLYSSAGEMYNAFKMGNIDLISTENINIKEYIGTIGYVPKEIKGREHDFIAFNTQNSVVAYTEVRKAIAYSIDKSNIISSVYAGNYYVSNFPLDYGTWIYQEQNENLGYNLDQAKRILIDNGWTYSNKYWRKTENYKTQRISLNFVVKSSDESKVAVAENIKTQLENQGIRINLIKANDTQYQNYLKNKNYDMILCSLNLSVSPDLTTFFGDDNLSNYSNEEIKNIMYEVKNTTDEQILKEKYKRLGEIYENDVPYLSLYNNKYTIAYNSDLAGRNMEPNWFNSFYNINNWNK